MRDEKSRIRNWQLSGETVGIAFDLVGKLILVNQLFLPA
jgi:hypothetical protein